MQGFAYLNNNDNIEKSEVETAMNDQVKELTRIKEKYDSIQQIRKLSQQVFKELKVQYPSLRSFIFEPVDIVQDTMRSQLWLSIIRSSSAISTSDRNKIDKWLLTRTGVDSIKYIYER